MTESHTKTSAQRSLGGRAFDRFVRPALQLAIASEVSSLTRHCDRTLLLPPHHARDAFFFERLQCKVKVHCSGPEELQLGAEERSLVLLNGNLNHQFDAQALLLSIHSKIPRGSRVGIVIYNSYLRLLYQWANRLGLREGELPCTFLTQAAVANIARVSGFELVRARPVAYLPFSRGPGKWLNQLLQAIPVVRWMGFAEFVVLRPRQESAGLPSLSIVIPARNEKGNIRPALERMPGFQGARLELLFVEGHSNDGTREEIQRLIPEFQDRFSLHLLTQTGKGKGDAVRLGLAQATGELVTILDADLTMPPELLPRFYDAYVQGHADFINGNRLVYPMEGEAMRFLNWLGNVFFAKSLSWVLDTSLGDSLCGTKLLSRADYLRCVGWREEFGDFDPFGDFELLFPAAVLGLGIVDIPIRYRARTYGSTKIQRFRHGWMLLQMTWTGFWRIRVGRG